MAHEMSTFFEEDIQLLSLGKTNTGENGEIDSDDDFDEGDDVDYDDVIV